MTRIHQSSSPFCNAERRKEMGLVTLTEISKLAGVSHKKIAMCADNGILSPPVKVSPTGMKRLWSLSDAMELIEKTDFDNIVNKESNINPFDNRLALNFHALKPPQKPVLSLRELAEKHDRKPKFEKRHLGVVSIKSDWKY